jgi:hypothetical protein
MDPADVVEAEPQPLPQTAPTERRPASAHWALLLPACVSVIVLLLLSPALLVQHNTPAGYDLGAHLYPYGEGVQLLHSEGRILGWSHGWFAGFPLFYFYFPLPVLPMALLSPFLGMGAALKIVSVLGILLFPFAAFGVLRGLSVAHLPAGIAALFASVFLFMQSFWFLGGNISSTLAGEFSYGLSFTLSLAYVGVVTRAVDERWRGGPWAALLLAGSALSHILTTLVVVLASATLLWERHARARVLRTWLHGFAIAAFWALPFLARIELVPHMGWEWDRSWRDLLPVEVLPVVPFALLGVLLSVQLGIRAAPLLALPVIAVVLWLLPQQGFLPTRPLPYWYFALHALAALIVAGGVQEWRNPSGHGKRRSTLLAAAAAVLALLFTNAFRDVTQLQQWAEFNYSGYETKPGWNQYRELMEVLRQLPEGRVHWEDAAEIKRYGTPHALALIPYWTRQAALGGLWVESSQLTPYFMRVKAETSAAEATRADPRVPAEHRLDFDRGVAHLRALGVRYYIAFTPQAAARADARPDLRRVAASPSLVVYEIAGVDIVSVATTTPVVHDGADFESAAAAWFDDTSGLDRWLVAEGPAAWPRSSADASARPLANNNAAVSAVRLSRDSIAFRTSAVGVPHLVRVNWFPNWRAEGATGPHRAAPTFMVVVPTQPEVRLVWKPGTVEHAGIILSALGLGALLLYPLAWRRRH